MMISKSEISQVIREYGRQPAVDAAARSGAAEKAAPDRKAKIREGERKPRSDQVDVSGLAQEVAKVKEAVKKLPEVRADKIAALKEQVASGRYYVPASEIADKMIGRHIADRIK